MSQAPFRVRLGGSWEYEEAYLRMLRSATDGFIKGNSFVGDIPSMRSKHSGALRHSFDDRTLDRRATESRIDVTVPAGVFRNLDVDGHTEFLHAIAEGQIRERVQSVCQMMEQATEFTGRSLPEGDRAFSWENYLIVLDRMTIPFEEDGTAKLPQLHVHPDLADKIEQMAIPDGYRARFDELIQKKREEWFASKRSRRLS